MIRGKQIILRPAVKQDKRPVYEWLAESDTTPSFMGQPHFPDNPAPSWDEFMDDYKPYFFDGSRPESGRCFIILVNNKSVGQVNYDNTDQHRRTELDIWMSCEANCGKGYGPDALETLCKYLFNKYGITEFVIRPSVRNLRAISAYEKAGFQRKKFTPSEEEAEFGPRDYDDSIVLIKRISGGIHE